MNFMKLIILCMIVYACIYALIGRICKCIEHCATARSFSKFVDANRNMKNMVDTVDDLQEACSKFDDICKEGGLGHGTSRKTEVRTSE